MAQTYDNWELIFWDNQSTDDTYSIVKSYQSPKIHYFYAHEHTQLGEARNFAVNVANGDYINFLDADDVWAPDKLEMQVAQIVPHEAEVVYTPFKVIYGVNVNGKMKAMYLKHERRKCYEGDVYDKLLLENHIIFSSVLMSRALYQACGGVNGYFQQYEDWELLLKASLKTRFAVAKDTYTFYRVHGGNNTSKNGVKCILEMREILENLPASKAVSEANKRNETRYAYHYYIKKCKILTGIKHVFRYGDIFFLISLVPKWLSQELEKCER
jgi:glycosyltransferase involved in cell wall biosynthesis